MRKISKLFIYLALTMVILFSGSAYANTKWEIYSNSQEFTQPEKTLTLQEKFAILEPYSKALITMFGEIAIRYNTEMPFEELIKNMTKKAFDAMLEMDKHGQAFTPEEYQEFRDKMSGVYMGIGAYIDQPEKWILKENTETPLPKEDKRWEEKTKGAILNILATDPDGNIITDLYKNISIGSKLIIKQISSQNPDKLLISKYEYERDFVQIFKVVSGGGAEKNGLKDGDIILEVNGKSTKNFTISENTRNIMGPKGTKVSLLIKRDDKQFYALIERSIVNLNKATTETKTIEKNNIGYIKFAEFNEEVSNIFHEWLLKDVKNKNINKIIIDLRNNPGGYLQSATEMLDFLTPKGTTLICVKNRREIQEVHKSYNNPIFSGKIIVLVNEMSASASEIMSGALQQNGFKIAGEKTFGKGSVQMTFMSPKNEAIKAIKLTIQEYQVYNQSMNEYIKIDGIGVKPDIECDSSWPVEEIIELPKIKEYFGIK